SAGIVPAGLVGGPVHRRVRFRAHVLHRPWGGDCGGGAQLGGRRLPGTDNPGSGGCPPDLFAHEVLLSHPPTSASCDRTLFRVPVCVCRAPASRAEVSSNALPELPAAGDSASRLVLSAGNLMLLAACPAAAPPPSAASPPPAARTAGTSPAAPAPHCGT